MASIFNYGHLSSAQLDRWDAPTQRPIIDHHPVEKTAYRREIKDNGYKSIFTNSWLVRHRNRSWIKGLGKNPQKEWTHSLLAVPFVQGHRTVAPWTPRNHDGTACVACWQGSRQNTRKSECAFRRSPIGRSKKYCVFIRPLMQTG